MTAAPTRYFFRRLTNWYVLMMKSLQKKTNLCEILSSIPLIFLTFSENYPATHPIPDVTRPQPYVKGTDGTIHPVTKAGDRSYLNPSTCANTATEYRHGIPSLHLKLLFPKPSLPRKAGLVLLVPDPLIDKVEVILVGNPVQFTGQFGMDSA
jgi:hypothetical protein